MLILDTDGLARHESAKARASHEQDLTNWIEEQSRHSPLVEDGDLNPGNVERQLGRTMSSHAFEQKLEGLLPANVGFLDNPFRPQFRAIVRFNGDGTFTTLVPYKTGILPEHSVLRVKSEFVRDMTQKHIERADLPKHEITPEGVVFDPGALRPGWKKIWHVMGEDPNGFRGWRTILIRLVQAGVLTPSTVERFFSADDRLEWAVGVGKRHENLPY